MLGISVQSSDLCEKDQKADAAAGSGVTTFLLPGQLLGLVPDLGGVQEVGGDLDVAGRHLVDPLGDGDGGAGAAAAAAAADGRVAARRAGGQLWRDGGGHPGRLAAGRHTHTHRQRCGQDAAG